MLDYVMTIDSDNEEPTPGPSKKAGEEVNLNPELSFDVAGDAYIDFGDPFATNDVLKLSSKPELISIDEIIARRATRKRKLEIGDTESESEEDDELSDEELDRDNFSDAEGVSTRDGNEEGGSELEDETEDDHDGNSSSDDSEEETQAEKERKAAFFDTEDSSSKAHESFVSMNLSRPILKALTSLGFQQPTPIQSATVPVALLGKDVVGNAVTGSGKTAAFIIPIIERLLYRDKGKHAAATRCIILCPTRELAAQCYEVGTKLASHTDIRLCLIVGGLSLKSQESSLRTRPDIVVATPGRLIDHIRNSPSFSLDALDVLVLDEADRMLSEGFADELNEIIKTCPKSRQTMLFSATMTDSVDELVRMSLNKPVRLFVDPKKTTAKGLVQEFVRVRSTKESERSAILVALCKRVFKSNVIVFLRSKRLAHQMRIVFGLLGMNCEELHGDLTQEQRLKALQHFRDGKSDFLMATDLASRGLDIKGVQTVINYDMPSQLAQYLHRVGRTARAGKKGRSVTLVGEADRKFLKAAIKHASDQDRVRHRVIPAEVISRWSQKLTEMKDEISMILLEEKEQKQIRQAEMELKKGENMIQHEEEIFSRPARTWFQSGKEKSAAQAISKQKYEGISTTPGSKSDDKEKPKRDKFAGLSRKAKRRRMLDEEEKKEGDKNGINAAIRSAKKASRPTKLQTFKRATEQSQSSQKSKSKKRSESGFSQDLADRSRTNKAGGKSGKGRGRL